MVHQTNKQTKGRNIVWTIHIFLVIYIVSTMFQTYFDPSLSPDSGGLQ